MTDLFISDEGLKKLEQSMNLSLDAKKIQEELISGNNLFKENLGLYFSDKPEPSPEAIKKLSEFQKKIRVNSQEASEHQEPKVAIVGCSDSRVTPHIIFSRLALNDTFSVLNAGNILSPVALESLNVPASHNTTLILFLGHTNCGAMNACAKERTSLQKNQNMAIIVDTIGKSAPKEIKNADELAVYNVAMDLYNFVNSNNDGIKKALESGITKVAGAIYDMKTFSVSFLDYITVANLLNKVRE